MSNRASALSGVRVVSMAQNVPGPVAVARLVAFGAVAIKVEPPAGDPLAEMSPAWYQELHACVDAERLDLKSDAGAARMDTLLAQATVLVSSHRPSSLHRLRLDGDTVRRRHGHLRVVNIVGDTAAPEIAGHDLTYQAKAGLLGSDMPVTLLADLMAAEQVVSTVLLALRHEPASWQVGLTDALETMRAPRRHQLTTPGARLGGGIPEYGIYETLEGRVAIAALEPAFRLRLYAELGLPDGSALDDVMRTRSAIEWEQWARARDLPLCASRKEGD